MRKKILPSEAIFAFAAWLTTREESLTVGYHENTCGEMAELADLWCKTNDLKPIRNDVYPNNITQPQVNRPNNRVYIDSCGGQTIACDMNDGIPFVV